MNVSRDRAWPSSRVNSSRLRGRRTIWFLQLVRYNRACFQARTATWKLFMPTSCPYVCRSIVHTPGARLDNVQCTLIWLSTVNHTHTCSRDWLTEHWLQLPSVRAANITVFYSYLQSIIGTLILQFSCKSISKSSSKITPKLKLRDFIKKKLIQPLL
jgi:hypothetical protein